MEKETWLSRLKTLSTDGKAIQQISLIQDSLAKIFKVIHKTKIILHTKRP